MRFENFSESDLPNIAAKINKQLVKADPFVVWLEAPMGAGKTTLTRHLLHDLGWSKNLPVQSPTFTYVHEYLVDRKRYAHIDLYRLESAAGLAQIGLDSLENFSGYFIEWPKILAGEIYLQPTHFITIIFCEDHATRRLEFLSAR